MSRTDVHRPYEVQIKDPFNRHRLRRFQMYSTEPAVLIPTYRTHNCPSCCGRNWRRLDNRSDRQRVKRLLRKGFGEDGFPKRMSVHW